jgi:hypothetical protein
LLFAYMSMPSISSVESEPPPLMENVSIPSRKLQGSVSFGVRKLPASDLAGGMSVNRT